MDCKSWRLKTPPAPFRITSKANADKIRWRKNIGFSRDKMQGVLSYITILLKTLLQAEKQKKVMVFFVAKQTTNICTFSLDIRGQKRS